MATGKRRQMKLKRTIRKTLTNVIEHDIQKSAAALTYNLLFALFPLLIFVSNLLGLLDLNVASITSALLPIMPDDVVYFLESYLNHITDNSSEALFWFSFVFTVWFPMRAVKGLMDDVRLAYGLGKPAKPVFYAIRQFLFTIVFLVIIIVLFLLALLGRRFVAWLGINHVLQIPPILLNLWQYLRFALLAAIMFAVVGMLYAAAQDRKKPGWNNHARCGPCNDLLAFGQHWLFCLCRKLRKLFCDIRNTWNGYRFTGLVVYDIIHPDLRCRVQCFLDGGPGRIEGFSAKEVMFYE